MASVAEQHEKSKKDMLSRISRLEQEWDRAINMWKEADRRIVQGVGSNTEYSTDFVSSLIKCFRMKTTETEFIVQLNTKLRKWDAKIKSLVNEVHSLKWDIR